jgi:hypothetical protein
MVQRNLISKYGLAFRIEMARELDEVVASALAILQSRN